MIVSDNVLNPAEINQRACDFWKEWLTHEALWVKLDALEFVEKGNQLLEQYLPGTVLELDGDTADGKLVFSANGAVKDFPKVERLVACAQTERPVEAFRQRIGAQQTKEFTICMDGFSLSADEVLAAYFPYDQRIDLELKFAKTIDEEHLPHAQNMALIMLDHLLGEWDFAVKVGVVDFVETIYEHAVPLHELPAQIDGCWREELHHSGLYPAPEWQYALYKCEEDEEHDALILTRNQSAAQLLGRADMAWCIIIDCDILDQAEVDAARDLEDDFFARIATMQQGIGVLSMVNLSRGVRSVCAYCGDGVAGEDMAQKSIAIFPALRTAIRVEYDPTWVNYRF